MSSSISSSDRRRAGVRFLLAWVGWLGLASAAVTVWNYLVDPYEMYHGWTWQGWNHAKAGNLGAYDRMAKAKEIAWRRPEGLLLGTSRVDVGLEPSHPHLRAITANYYNAGLAGATIYEVLRYLQHAQAVGSLRQVILGLDVEMFIAGSVRETYRDRRLAVRPDGTPNPWFRCADLWPTLFTQDALEASWATLNLSRRFRDIPPEQYARRGQPAVEDLDADTRWRMYKLGVRQARANLGPLNRRRDDMAAQLPPYEAVLGFAHDHAIELVMFITPYHVSHLEAIRQGGGWETFEWWKRELVRANHRVAADRARPAFPLWDFSGYHHIATEPVPTARFHQRIMHWYRESSHYRKRTGDVMLERMAGRSYPEIPDPYFGVTLRPDNLEDVLRIQREFRDRWVRKWLTWTPPTTQPRPAAVGSTRPADPPGTVWARTRPAGAGGIRWTGHWGGTQR